jgi:hypothetical protein
MELTRYVKAIGLNINFPDHPQAAALPTPVLVQLMEVRDENGKQVGQPTMQQSPTVAGDYTDERLAELNGVFTLVGLKLVREA